MPGALFPRVKHYVSPRPSYLTPAHDYHHDNHIYFDDDQCDDDYHDLRCSLFQYFDWESTHLSYCLTGHLTLRVVPTQTVARPPTLSFTTCNDDGDDADDDDAADDDAAANDDAEDDDADDDDDINGSYHRFIQRSPGTV